MNIVLQICKNIYKDEWFTKSNEKNFITSIVILDSHFNQYNFTK